MFPKVASFLGADPVTLIREGIAELAGSDRSEWSDAARSELLAELLEVSDSLRAEVLREAGEWDARQAWAADGALSASSWIADRAPVSKRDAHELVRTARLVFDHVRTAKALAAGDITAAKVEVLAAAAKGRARLYDRDEDVLLDIAPTLNVDDFTIAAKHWRSCADDEMARTDAAHVFETREVTMVSTLMGRAEIHASLDAEGGRIVSAALEAYDRPDPDDGVEVPRTLAQRHADALVQICSEAVGRKQAEHGVHYVPTVDLVCDEDRLSYRGSPCLEGSGPTAADLLARREVVGVAPVSADVARRISCSAAVSRVDMRGSEVLALGRSSRLPTRAMRRALDRRDRGCVFPGCGAPLTWCDAHHLVHWADGGPTDLENLVLLCRRHHVACHEGGWQLTRPPGGPVEVTRRGVAIRSRSRARPRGRPKTGRPGDESRAGHGAPDDARNPSPEVGLVA